MRTCHWARRKKRPSPSGRKSISKPDPRSMGEDGERQEPNRPDCLRGMLRQGVVRDWSSRSHVVAGHRWWVRRWPAGRTSMPSFTGWRRTGASRPSSCGLTVPAAAPTGTWEVAQIVGICRTRNYEKAQLPPGVDVFKTCDVFDARPWVRTPGSLDPPDDRGHRLHR